MEYYQLEPFGAMRDNWHAALIASILANAYRDPKRQPVGMNEFFYVDSQQAEENRDKQTLAFLAGLKPND